MTSRSTSSLLRGLLLALGLVALAHLLDDPVINGGYYHKTVFDPGRKVPDWQLTFRTLGYLPLWWLLAGAIWLGHSDAAARRLKTGALRLLCVAPAVALLAGEVVKWLIRRKRPRDTDPYGSYEFWEWSWEVTTSKMGFPSSHAVVAFAGAAALSVGWPRGRLLWWALATGCAWSRVAAHHHFPSDVAMSAVIGALAVSWVRGWRGFLVAPTGPARDGDPE